MFIDLDSYEISSEERELLRHPFVSGVILFSRNFHNLSQLQELVREIREVKTPSLLIGVDQEGGTVQRFKEGFSILPCLGVLGDYFDKNPEWSKTLARDHAYVMATELLEVGIDFSFAPVVDLRDPCSEVIGDRAFHTSPNIVAILASVYVETMKKCGMSAVAKHFPGHGLLVEDSHFTLPVDERPLLEIMENDLLPYQKIIGIGLEGVMMAHVLYSKVDDRVAGYSKFWMNKVLRERLGFDGVIFSDDLNMLGAAAIDSYVERAKLALEAGCDCLLICNNRGAVEEILDANPSVSVSGEFSREDRLKKMRSKSLVQNRSELMRHPDWARAKANLKDITSS